MDKASKSRGRIVAAIQITRPSFTRSPIMRAELAYQRRGVRQRAWRRWLGRAVVLLAVTLALILYGGEIAGSLLGRDPTPVSETLGAGVALLLAYTTGLHFILMFRALAQGANSIAREKMGKTWDMLVLTGIDARQIVWGKWWATVRRLWRHYTLLALLRACVITWMGASASRSLMLIYGSYSTYYQGEYRIILPRPQHFILAGLVVAVLTMANLVFTAACGVYASAETRSSALALLRAIVTRLLVLVALVVLLLMQMGFFFNILHSPNPLQPLFVLVYPTLLDNGVTLGSSLVAYRIDGIPDMTPDVLATAVISLGLYALLTGLLLWAAQRRAIQQRALPPVDNSR
jgi:hypothetical protein